MFSYLFFAAIGIAGMLLDPNGDFKRAMNVQNVPHIFVLDGKGNVKWQHAGYTDGGEEEVRKHLGK